MKKIILLSLFFTTTFLIHSQNKSLTLIEHFTQASCPYCPAGNAHIDELYENHPDEVIVMRYQVWWPGYDPMYEHNPSDVDQRVAFYSVSAVPNSVYEGNLVNGSYNQITDALIENTSNETRPFEIELIHHLSEDHDSVYVAMNITATENIAGNIVAHIAIIERHIAFEEAPGSNGEKDFYNVMKKMLPTANGTILADSFSSGDEETIEVSWATRNVYNMNELAVIGFVQDNGNKKVLCTGFSDKKPAPSEHDYDLTITSVSGLAPYYCGENATLEPTITITNFGAVSLTSIDFHYRINQDSESTFTWTGAIPHTVKKEITLPSYSFEVGQNNILEIWGSNLNGQTDQNPSNDTLVQEISSSLLTNNKIILELQTDSKPHETFWKFIDPLDPSNPIARNIPYTATHANTLIIDTIEFENGGCYDFIIQDVNGLEPGSYYTLYDTNGQLIWYGESFIGKETISFEVSMEVAIQEQNDQDGIVLYPNPAHSHIMLQTTESKHTNAVVKVFNSTGQLILSRKLYDPNHGIVKLNCSNWENGIYFVQLKTDHINDIKKVMIQH